MGQVVNEEIEKYLRQLVPDRDELLTFLEEKAEREYVSIVVPEVAQFIKFLAAQKQAKDILEIGTAIGYSTIWLARIAKKNGGHVTTIEINQPRYEKALKSIEESGLAEIINVEKGHAADILPNFKENSFDFIFVDAAKGQYNAFLEDLYLKLKPQGIIVFDNVLADGLVVHEDKNIERRQRTMVRRLREFLKSISEHPGLITSIVPMGDGVSVSYKV